MSNTSSTDTNYFFQDRRFDLVFNNLPASTPFLCFYQGIEVTSKTQKNTGIPGETLISSPQGILSFSFYLGDGNILTDSLVDLTLNVVNNNIGNYNYQGNSIINLVDFNNNIVASKNLNLFPGIGIADYEKYTNTSSTSSAYSGNLISGSVQNPISCQTFYIDPNLVGNATEVGLTSINLYAKQKPAVTSSNSGVTLPGVTLVILPTSNSVPYFNSSTSYSATRLEFSEINTSIYANTPAKFSFSNPLQLSTGTLYAFVLIPDQDTNYLFWVARQGDNLVGNGAIGGPMTTVGNYFQLTSSSDNWTSISNTSLTYDINIARYAQNGVPYNVNANICDLYSRNYEFFLYDEIASGDVRLAGGETVFRLSNSVSTGSVTRGSPFLTATDNTNFNTLYSQSQDPQFVIISYGNGYYDVKPLFNILSNTSLMVQSPFSLTSNSVTFWKSPVAECNYTKVTIANGGSRRFVSLQYSTSNGSLAFANGDTIVGSFTSAELVNCQFFNIPVSYVNPEIYINTPTGSQYSVSQEFNYTTTDDKTLVNDVNPLIKPITMYDAYGFNYGDKPMFPSRTNELSLLANSSALSIIPSNGSIVEVDLTTINNDFVAPSISANGASVFFYYYCINNDYTNENTLYGNAFSRHITTKVNLTSNTAAEDIQVYLSAYRPPNTNLKVFAKIYNSSDSDYFDDKDWTLLQEIDSTTGPIYSAQQNTADFIELTYGFNLYPNSAYTANGLITCTSNNANIIGSQTTFGTDVVVGDIVKIYQPLFPNDYMIASVINVTNSSLLTIDQPVSNAGISQTGLYLDVIEYPFQAFNNILNDNVVRYYNSNKSYYDTYDTFSLKIVFLSNDVYTVPMVENIRAVAVSS